ncbi:hypothetical protein CVS27_14215 [Arthrobacter glacialis]|uniref:Uncharacterized protein n=1 Tax=Arthrobacter glacialis TaxID=1664 RepID=A0A2S3ZUA1_ARTGL|nr:hypothetical protein CVS27_14215 [Arthrobacter glacialis]
MHGLKVDGLADARTMAAYFERLAKAMATIRAATKRSRPWAMNLMPAMDKLATNAAAIALVPR